MKFTSAFAAVLAALPFASAVGTATVRNYCPKALSVYTTSGGVITGTHVLANGQNLTIPYPANGMTGAQVQVSPTNQTSNVVFWEFAQGNNIIYYDVNINGPTVDPFTQRGLSVTGTTTACPSIVCAAGGSTSCFNNPNGHQQNQVKACASTNSIFFNACMP